MSGRIRIRAGMSAALLVAVAAMMLLLPSRSDAGFTATPWHTTQNVSIAMNGQESDRFSYSPQINFDGRYVVFGSYSNQLVAGDNDSDSLQSQDSFWHDRVTGETQMLNVMGNGQMPPPDRISDNVDISDDGRLAVFGAYGPLVPGAHPIGAIYVRDVVSQTTELISRGMNGQQPDSFSLFDAISGDGRWVTFTSTATNLVPADPDEPCTDILGCAQVFLYDRQTTEMRLISRSAAGERANHDTLGDMDLSKDGRFVVYSTKASNIVPNDNNNFCDTDFDQQDDDSCEDVILFDRVTNTSTLVSRTPAGQSANESSSSMRISGDGRWVVFNSAATDLVPGDSNNNCDNDFDDVAEENCADIFLFDRLTNEVRLVPGPGGQQPVTGAFGPSITHDGRFIAFSSNSPELAPNAPHVCDSDFDQQKDDPCTHAFVYDRVNDSVAMADINSSGEAGDAGSAIPAISGNGKVIAMQSNTGNLAFPTSGERPNIIISELFGGVWQADVNCDGLVNPRDALTYFRYKAGLDPGQLLPCPEIGTNLAAGAAAQPAGFLFIFGDNNCDDLVGTDDAINSLLYSAGIPPEQPGCSLIGPPLASPTPAPTGGTSTTTKTPTPTPSGNTATPTRSPTPTPSSTAPPVQDPNCPFSGGTQQPIPDNDATGASVEGVFQNEGTIGDLEVCLNVNHTWPGDLVVTLTHVETGTTVTLLDRPGIPAQGTDGCGIDNLRVYFDDEAFTPAENVCNANPPGIFGSLRPAGSLSAFDGESFNGTWRVTAKDLNAQDTGALTGATLWYTRP